MKIAGHTMGTPELTIQEAAELFADIGLDGIEIVVQDDYKCGIPTNADNDYLDRLKAEIAKTGLHIVCLTPYNNMFNSPDDLVREKENDEIIRVVEMAAILGAQFIRIYGGQYNPSEEGTWNIKLSYMVSSMQKLGDIALEKGIILVVENHFMTMTDTAKNTMFVINAINHPNIKVLYDQANLGFVYGEEYEEAIKMQMEQVAYIHVKDYVYRKEKVEFKSSAVSHMSDEDRTFTPKVIGEGVLPWQDILKQIKDARYDGWLSLEYVRRWHPEELPEAKIGMAKEAKRIRQYLKDIDEATK